MQADHTDTGDVPAFTAALSEHSDGETDELQFGNVDLTSRAGAEPVTDGQPAVEVFLACSKNIVSSSGNHV